MLQNRIVHWTTNINTIVPRQLSNKNYYKTVCLIRMKCEYIFHATAQYQHLNSQIRTETTLLHTAVSPHYSGLLFTFQLHAIAHGKPFHTFQKCLKV